VARSFKHIGVRWVIGMERNFIAHRKREIHERTAHGNRSGHLLSARNRTSFPGWTYPVRAHYLKIDSSSLWHAASSTMYAGRADVTSIAIPLLNLLIFIFLMIQFDCAHNYLPNVWARALRYIFLQWLNSLNIWAWKPWVKWINNFWTHV